MTATRIDFTDRTDWLQKRRTGIGASDIAAIMGLSPWATPLQVWVSKTVDDIPEAEPSEDMAWGTRMESAIMDEAQERIGWMIDNRGDLWRNTERPWMLATPDGLIADAAGNPAGSVVEAKKTDAWTWDEIPTHYNLQVQWQMAVTGAPQAYIAALHRGRRLEIYPVMADPELQQELIEAGEHFWHLVETETPPPATGEDNAFLATLYPTAEEQAVEVAPEIAFELRLAKNLMTTVKSRLDDAEAALKEALQDADTAVVGQDVVATWKNQKRAEYTVAAKEFRVLRLKGTKDE